MTQHKIEDRTLDLEDRIEDLERALDAAMCLAGTDIQITPENRPVYERCYETLKGKEWGSEEVRIVIRNPHFKKGTE